MNAYSKTQEEIIKLIEQNKPKDKTWKNTTVMFAVEFSGSLF